MVVATLFLWLEQFLNLLHVLLCDCVLQSMLELFEDVGIVALGLCVHAGDGVDLRRQRLL